MNKLSTLVLAAACVCGMGAQEGMSSENQKIISIDVYSNHSGTNEYSNPCSVKVYNKEKFDTFSEKAEKQIRERSGINKRAKVRFCLTEKGPDGDLSFIRLPQSIKGGNKGRSFFKYKEGQEQQGRNIVAVINHLNIGLNSIKTNLRGSNDELRITEESKVKINKSFSCPGGDEYKEDLGNSKNKKRRKSWYMEGQDPEITFHNKNEVIQRTQERAKLQKKSSKNCIFEYANK